MGGHIAAELTTIRSICTLILLYPAAYAKEAEAKPFNEEFTKVLRSENSWHNSPAFQALEKYPNKVLVLYGEKDVVIPDGVKQRYQQLVTRKGKFISLRNAGHVLLSSESESERKTRSTVFKEILIFLKSL